MTGDDLGRISFLCPLPPPGLRTNSRTQKTGWRAALKRQYQEDVWCAAHEYKFRFGDMDRDWSCAGGMFGGVDRGKIGGLLGLPWERATLRLEWRHAGVAPDQDNALASLKSLIDVLHCKSNRPLSIVVDDSPEHLRIEPVQLVKVKHRADEGVLVTIAATPATEA